MSAVREAFPYSEADEADDMGPERAGGNGRVPEVETADIGALFRGTDAPEPAVAEAEPVPQNLAIALAVGQLTIDSAPTDWTRTLTLVERAAATIRAYEKRFLQLEKQSKALADRAAEDQHRLHAHIHSLEERLRQAEERGVAAETAARDAEYHEWEAEMRVKRAEQRAVEAEARARQTETYLRRVHELLSGVS